MHSFSLLITSASFAGQSFSSALAFARAALEAGHHIEQIFLYEEAVLAAAADIDLPADEPNLSALLADFCRQQNIPLLFCVTAAEKRGVVSDAHPAGNGYTAAGLAEFAMRLNSSARLVQF